MTAPRHSLPRTPRRAVRFWLSLAARACAGKWDAPPSHLPAAGINSDIPANPKGPQDAQAVDGVRDGVGFSGSAAGMDWQAG